MTKRCHLVHDGWHGHIISKWTCNQIMLLSQVTNTLPFTHSPVLNTGESFPSLSTVYCGHFPSSLPLLTACGVPWVVSPSFLCGIVLVVPFLLLPVVCILWVVSCLLDLPVLVIPLSTTIIIVLLSHTAGPALLTLWIHLHRKSLPSTSR